MRSKVLTVLVMAGALAAPAAASAATLSVSVDTPGAGTPAKPQPATLDIEFSAPAAPLGTLAIAMPPQFRLGGAGGRTTCAADQVAADACPPAARVASGSMSVLVPAPPDPYDSGYQPEPLQQDLDLSGYAAPGGGEIDFLAVGGYPNSIRTVIPGALSGSTLTLSLPATLAQLPGASLSDMSLELGSSDGSWPASTGCSGAWTFSVTATGAGAPASATDSEPCPAATSTELAPPDVKSIAHRRPSRHGRPSRGAAGLCGKPQAGVHCGPGYGRRTSGGGGKVSHQGWPAVTGILWYADDGGRHAQGTRLNDELLGGNGSDRLSGGGGDDILWGDQHPFPNGPKQNDVMSGGAGRDWIYTSHGTNTVDAGPGADHVYAFYGHGTIDCGGGDDVVWIHRIKANQHYAIRGCEQRKYF